MQLTLEYIRCCVFSSRLTIRCAQAVGPLPLLLGILLHLHRRPRLLHGAFPDPDTANHDQPGRVFSANGRLWSCRSCWPKWTACLPDSQPHSSPRLGPKKGVSGAVDRSTHPATAIVTNSEANFLTKGSPVRSVLVQDMLKQAGNTPR